MNMTWNEIVDVLKLATVYDHGQRDESDVMGWLHVAQISGWKADEAKTAVVKHFAVSDKYLMPAHVGDIIRAQRRQPMPLDLPALPPASPASQAHRRRLIAGLADRLRWQHRPRDTQPAPLRVQCPHCHARPDTPCTRRIGRGHRQGQFIPLSGFHDSRIELAKDL